MLKTLTCAIFITLSLHSASARGDEPTEDPTPKVDGEERKNSAFGSLDLRGQIECRRNIGIAGGLVSIAGTWEFVGNGPLAITGSPMLSMTCDGGGDLIAFSLGIESAPFYVHRTFNIGTKEQWMTLTAGFLMGSDSFRYGAIASLGVGYAGAGLRAMWMPWETRKNVRRGFEFRVIPWFADKVSVQAVVLVHLTAHRRSFKLSLTK